jgi:hypothetical protein
MTDLTNHTLIDVSSGTMLTAHNCVLVSCSDLSESEWDELDNASDSEIIAIGRERGKPLSQLIPTLDPSTITAFGDLLEQAQERLDDAMHMLDEEDVERETKALDNLWELYQRLM